MFNMIAQSKVRNAGFEIITKDDINDSRRGITRLVHKETEKTSLICVERPERLHEAALTFLSVHVAKSDGLEIW